MNTASVPSEMETIRYCGREFKGSHIRYSNAIGKRYKRPRMRITKLSDLRIGDHCVVEMTFGEDHLIVTHISKDGKALKAINFSEEDGTSYLSFRDEKLFYKDSARELYLLLYSDDRILKPKSTIYAAEGWSQCKKKSADAATIATQCKVRGGEMQISALNQYKRGDHGREKHGLWGESDFIVESVDEGDQNIQIIRFGGRGEMIRKETITFEKAVLRPRNRPGHHTFFRIIHDNEEQMRKPDDVIGKAMNFEANQPEEWKERGSRVIARLCIFHEEIPRLSHDLVEGVGFAIDDKRDDTTRKRVIVGSVGSVGVAGGIAGGALIGQFLIPIPGIGAVIGGAVAGALWVLLQVLESVQG